MLLVRAQIIIIINIYIYIYIILLCTSDTIFYYVCMMYGLVCILYNMRVTVFIGSMCLCVSTRMCVLCKCEYSMDDLCVLYAYY